MATPIQAANELSERLPEQASWNAIMYELYVKQKIAAGLSCDRGRTVPHEEIKRRSLDLMRRTNAVRKPTVRNPKLRALLKDEDSLPDEDQQTLLILIDSLLKRSKVNRVMAA